jgi:hypothetical protein
MEIKNSKKTILKRTSKHTVASTFLLFGLLYALIIKFIFSVFLESYKTHEAELLEGSSTSCMHNSLYFST